MHVSYQLRCWIWHNNLWSIDRGNSISISSLPVARTAPSIWNQNCAPLSAYWSATSLLSIIRSVDDYHQHTKSTRAIGTFVISRHEQPTMPCYHLGTYIKLTMLITALFFRVVKTVHAEAQLWQRDRATHRVGDFKAASYLEAIF